MPSGQGDLNGVLVIVCWSLDAEVAVRAGNPSSV